MTTDTKKLYFINAVGDEYLVAIARLVPACGFSPSPRLIVDLCPFCGEVHRHGVSEWTGDGIYGKRQADCFKGEYLLVEQEAIDRMPTRFVERDTEVS